MSAMLRPVGGGEEGQLLERDDASCGAVWSLDEEEISQALAPIDAQGQAPTGEMGVSPRREGIDAIHSGYSARRVEVDLQAIDPALARLLSGTGPAFEQFNSLAIAVMLAAEQRRLRRLVVASAQRGEGRTTVALCLALALARAHRRTLVVDCDLHNPSVHRSLGVAAEISLSDALVYDFPADMAVLSTVPLGFDVLPSLDRMANPSTVLAAPSFRVMLERLEAVYDVILIDSSPLVEAADANLLLHTADSALLVVRAGRTTTAQMARAVAPLTADQFLGVVLNRVVR